MFEVQCLHIPVMDRTSFRDLVKIVERTVRLENARFPDRPIYIVGESLGGCLALAVAERNPEIDLLLILANPATSFNKSQIQAPLPFLAFMLEQLQLSYPFILSLMADSWQNLHVLADILPKETLLWKLQMLESASAYTNSRIHAVKAETLLLTSGKDRLLPSQAEGARLNDILQRSQIRKFDDCGHFLFLEDGFDLVTIIKGVGFYRHGKGLDYVSDYLPPTPAEYKTLYESSRLLLPDNLDNFRRFDEITGPVMLSTLEDGRIVRGLDGIPSEGPVLYVGYHMLLGLEVSPLIRQFLNQRNIHVRGIAHPMLLDKYKKGQMPGPEFYDILRMVGAVPVSGTNLFKLLSSKSHVLLYPGGVREALHRKGEEYKLFWPEQSEFVRMAVRFGAKIVPFGSAGEDDFGEVFFDYDDQMKIPLLRNWIKQMTEDTLKVRSNATGEVANQDLHIPWIWPKIPGRLYYCFGKPIETAGWKQELNDREKCHELYLQVKSDVESRLAYLIEKRERDPYRSIFSRLMYQATHGSASEIPTFEL
ncbi:hypothetical protein BT93_I1071 [Corymbia citriodora subsp. variegata]|nr:hypothetical protein BT93_I1071 [Corymbia citriodora subsp. variegata]